MITSPRLLYLAICSAFVQLPMSENNGIYTIVSNNRNVRSFDQCTKLTNFEALTRCVLHLNTGLNAASNIKPSRIVNITRQEI